MNKDGIIIFVRKGSFHFRDHLVQRNDAAAGKIPYLRVKQDDGAVFSRLRFVHKHIVEDIRIFGRAADSYRTVHRKDDIGIEHGNVFISHLLPMNPHLDVFISLGHSQGIVYQPKAGTRTVSAYLAVVRKENESFLAAGLGLVLRTGYGFINVLTASAAFSGTPNTSPRSLMFFLASPS